MPDMQPGRAETVAPGVRRLLAPNPSAMTGPGTNSYLLEDAGDLIVVDPGPLIEAHLAALVEAAGTAARISAIIVTHAHLDHSAAAPALSAQTGAPVLAFGDAASGRSALMQRLSAQGLGGGGEGIDRAFRPDRLLADGAYLSLGGRRIEVIHTPGHMGGHLCLALDDILFSGDHAMAWASTLVSPPDGDMGAYMASLTRLEARSWGLMLPGHGPEVPDPATRLADLRRHRLSREAEILAALSRGPARIAELTHRIYHDTPPALLPAARRNVLAHLVDLLERNLVSCDDLADPETYFAPTRP